MATKQIPSLPPVIALAGPEQFETVQAGNSMRVALAQISDFVRSRMTPPTNAFPSRLVSDVADPYQMLSNDGEVVFDLSAPGPINVLLPPAPAFGHIARVSDGKGDADINNITIAAAGGTINGTGVAVVIATAWGTRQFRSLGGDAWSIL